MVGTVVVGNPPPPPPPPLSEQPFVKDDKQSVGKVASAGGMKLVKFIRWQLGETGGTPAA